MQLETRSHYHLLNQADSLHKDSPAQYIRDKNRTFQPFSFHDFVKESRLVSKVLLSMNANHGDHVGIIADVGPRWLRVSTGITAIGCVDVPRGSDATIDDIRYILTHATVSLLFTDNEKVLKKFKPVIETTDSLKQIIVIHGPLSKDFTNSIKNKDGNLLPVHLLDDLINSVYNQPQTEIAQKIETEYHERGRQVKESDLATIIYTSGTTGVPKGVMLTHGSMLWEASVLHQEFTRTGVSVGKGDITMGFLPPWHSGERMFETICFFSGAAVAFTSVGELARDMKSVRPTFLFTVPRVWENFYAKILDNVKAGSQLNRTMFRVFVGTAKLYRRVLDTLLDRQPRFTSKRTPAELGRFILSAFLLPVLFLPGLLSRRFLQKILSVLGGRVRFAFAGAGALQPEVDHFFYAIGLPLLEVYGMTENSGVSTIRHLNRFMPGTVGRVLTGVEIKLIDDSGQTITEPGIKGVALHRGPHNMQGYYKEPKKTKAIIDSDRWLNSGDLLMWTAQGDLKFAGRAKDTIVLSGGENVEPEPIENSLKQSEYFTHVVVVGQDQKTLGALIVLNKEKVQPLLTGSNNYTEENLNRNEAITRLVRNEIKKYVSSETGYKAFEKITAFHLLANEFTVNDELTQTQKVRRVHVQDKYKTQIEGMFR